MKNDLQLKEVFDYRTGFNPIYQIQIRGLNIFGGGWSENWQTKERFATMQECIDDIATYHPDWFEKNQVRITELATAITIRATAPLPVTYAKKLEERERNEHRTRRKDIRGATS
jgi:hypothetical protein